MMSFGFSEGVFEIGAFILSLVIGFIAWAVVEDADKAWRGTSRGDHWRLFCYYQAARYGVKPREK